MTTKFGAARAAYAPTLKVVTDGAAEPRAAITRAIEEVLNTVTIPIVRERLMNRALKSAGLRCAPVSRMALRYFIEGPLYQTLLDVLGDETADALLTELRDVADRAATTPTPVSGTRTIADFRPPTARRQMRTTKVAIPRLRPSLVPSR